ncbi:uncharacterized protein B0H18DRAFT_27489 [Fomitopsis serialis]|uniref:uncharacterized protein n=1 Tax=Fomitopsis serialis TaxID=139415 RepID=UPI00200833A3|nr:uncharacterized protein B0H18DRAFT_27489 [Neoantrodia serialis]KAH9932504.1 hypothetical protein B0H18DRAFT_27489 [Neoantrodia serialis]
MDNCRMRTPSMSAQQTKSPVAADCRRLWPPARISYHALGLSLESAFHSQSILLVLPFMARIRNRKRRRLITIWMPRISVKDNDGGCATMYVRGRRSQDPAATLACHLNVQLKANKVQASVPRDCSVHTWLHRTSPQGVRAFVGLHMQQTSSIHRSDGC